MDRFTQTDIPGDQYTRAKRIIFENPKDGNRSMTCVLETITNTAKEGEYVKTDEGILISNPPATAEDLTEEVTLYGLEGEVYGTIPRGEMLQKLMLFINSEMIHDVVKQARLTAERLAAQEQAEADLAKESEASGPLNK